MERSAGGTGEKGGVVLVATSSPAEAVALARAFEEGGYCVFRAATPLELIHCLEYRGDDIALVVLGARLGGCGSDELASYLAEAHPEIRRVLVARRGWGLPASTQATLGTVLEKPWSADLIRSALSSELMDVNVGREKPKA